MDAAPFVVVGASLAGLRAVEEARAGGYSGRIVLVGSEPHPPYDRPPLSKQFLAPGGLPDYLALEAELRDSLEVEFWSSRTAVALDADGHSVTMDDGESLDFGTLVIATGAAPRTLPQLEGKDGVFVLRTLDDARALRDRLIPGSNLVVIGAGFIGSEIASSAKQRGAHVVVVESAPVPLARAFGPVVGELAASLHAKNGVRLLVSTDVLGLVGGDAVEGVRLRSGEVLPADTVVVGIGAAPTTGWLRDSGIRLSPVDGGIVCDEFLRTSAPDLYAAGDLVHWPNHLLGSAPMRVENWTNAADQGRRAARNALWPDDATPYTTVPYFWSDWYEQRLQFVGTASADEVRVVTDDPDQARWTALYRSGDRLIGAATLNERRKIMKYRRMIANRTSWQQALDAFPSAPDAAS